MSLQKRIFDICNKRKWSTHWKERGVYLHLECSELIEALRGKSSNPADEAADVLFVLLSILEANDISFDSVIDKLEKLVANMEKE